MKNIMEIVNKKSLIYLFGYLTTVINYLTRRGIGVILPIISKALSVPVQSLVFVQSFFGLSRTIVCLFTGPWFDKNPRIMFKIGVFLQLISVCLIILFQNHYHIFISSLLFLALGYVILSLSIWNILTRSVGYGRTYDVMWVGVGMSSGPIIMLSIIHILKSSTITMIFLTYGILLLIAASLFLYFTKDIDVRKGETSSYKKLFSNMLNLSIIRSIPILSLSVSADVTIAVFTIYMMSLGFTFFEASLYTVIVYATSSIVSRFIFSWIGYNYGSKNAMLIGMIVCSIAWLCAINPNFVILSLILLGLGTGSGSINVFPYIADKYGRTFYFANYSVFAVYGGLFEGSMVWLSSLILSITKNYNFVFTFMVILMIICFIIIHADKTGYIDRINGVKIRD